MTAPFTISHKLPLAGHRGLGALGVDPEHGWRRHALTWSGRRTKGGSLEAAVRRDVDEFLGLRRTPFRLVRLGAATLHAPYRPSPVGTLGLVSHERRAACAQPLAAGGPDTYSAEQVADPCMRHRWAPMEGPGSGAPFRGFRARGP